MVQDGDANDGSAAQTSLPLDGRPITINVKTDDYGTESYWEILNEDFEVIASRGQYGEWDDNVDITTSVCLPPGCYQFKMYDRGGNGMSINSGIEDATYTVTDD